MSFLSELRSTFSLLHKYAAFIRLINLLLDIDKWLGVFSFTVKSVSKIMSAFGAHTIDGLTNGGKLPLAAIPAFSNDC